MGLADLTRLDVVPASREWRGYRFWLRAASEAARSSACRLFGGLPDGMTPKLSPNPASVPTVPDGSIVAVRHIGLCRVPWLSGNEWL